MAFISKIANHIENNYDLSKESLTIIFPNKRAALKLRTELTKKEYKDSTHICYAYIINSSEKCSDDGEPNGTAGLPILNILKKNNLTNVLAIVIRYFGGIKLGAGGLLRAYSDAANKAVSQE